MRLLLPLALASICIGLLPAAAAAGDLTPAQVRAAVTVDKPPLQEAIRSSVREQGFLDDAVAHAKAALSRQAPAQNLVRDLVAAQQLLSNTLRLEQSCLASLRVGSTPTLAKAGKDVRTLKQEVDHFHQTLGVIALSDMFLPSSDADRSDIDSLAHDFGGMTDENSKASLLIIDLYGKLRAQLPRSLFP